MCVCRWRGEGWRHPQALPPVYLSQETPPPKDKLLLFLPTPAASWETAHSSVSTRSHTLALLRTKIPWSPERIHSLMLLYGLPAQVWKPQVWGRGFDTRFCPWQVTWRWWVWLTGGASTNEIKLWCLSDCQRALSLPHVTCWSSGVSVSLMCADVDLDAVVASTEKLSHPTASRPRVTDRRPRSQIITPVSVFVVGLSWRFMLLMYMIVSQSVVEEVLNTTV